MLNEYIRVIKKDDTVYTDISLDNANESIDSPMEVIAAEDAIYVLKQAPFNNLFFYMGVANTNSSVMTVSYWDNKEWRNAIDLLDGTSLSGASLGQSGNIQFTPDRDKTWTKIGDTSDIASNTPVELRDFTLYNMYALRITFSNDLSATTAVKRTAYNFTDEQGIKKLDIDISEFLAVFGQTDWIPQMLTASLEVVDDCFRRGLIRDEGELLRFRDVYLPTAYQTLSLIYLNLGDNYRDKRKDVMELYEKAMSKGVYSLDRNHNAILENQEFNAKQFELYR